MMTPDTLELDVMAHRYLYYVESDPTLPDSAYDQLERQARAACPPESPVHGIGSSLPSSYTAEQVQRAKRISWRV
jgi:NAD-dependent DNA ligase